MRSITTVAVAVVAVVAVCAMAMTPQHATRPEAGVPSADATMTYEHLATAIIAIRETENSLVHAMLSDYAASARGHLMHAVDASGTDRKRMLEAAATEITNLANEGDKRIQAVRQRLLKAGHHHNTDESTQEDYMFVSSAEKNELLALAGEVARMTRATPAEIRGAMERFVGLADQAMKAE